MKILSTLAMVSMLLLSGCSFVDVDVKGTEIGHHYVGDINEAERYNAGSDYFAVWIGEADPRLLYIDYGVQSVPFSATYTLPIEQKVSIKVEAELLFKLKKNPSDNGNMRYKDDQYAQYFATSITPTADSSRDYAYSVSPVMLWGKLMSEPTDLAFRSVFTDSERYDSFDTVESSIVEIQKAIKQELSDKALQHYIELVGVKIKDIRTKYNN